MEMEEPAKDQPPTLQEELETATTQQVEATFGTNLPKMSSKLLTVESTAGLCLIDEKRIPKMSHRCI